jgi:26S proteasome regulatory subunit N7
VRLGARGRRAALRRATIAALTRPLPPPAPTRPSPPLRLAAEQVAAAKALNDKGGDWDRRNRLKVYEGVIAITARDFPRAAATLLDSVSTFTATELLSYEHFVFLAVLVAIKTLPRAALKKSIIDSPDVIAVLAAEGAAGADLTELMGAFYDGRYAAFFGALTRVAPRLAADRWVAPHAAWLGRELRIAAYAQFLESYKSVQLVGMAAAFGVSPAFLDGELATLIAAGRVSAKVDAVAGIVESARADTKNAQYAAVIKKGDALLNAVQKLSRTIAL